MSDHQDYCNSFIHGESDDTQNEIEDFPDNARSIEDKNSDDYLIELFRERSFLYDKSNPDFKNTLMKQDAWNKISHTMIASNYGDFYTPEYCRKRCTSLRDQYNREKKKIENQSKSGKTASNSNARQFLFYSQLKFLDKVIKRRRTYNSVTRSVSNATLDKKLVTCDLGDVSVCSPDNTESQHNKFERTANKIFETPSSKVKRRKMDEHKQLEQISFNVTNRIRNSITSESPLSPVDNAFMEFIKMQFATIPEHEKNMRRKMILDAVSAPLPKT
ncbi:PREDICTED: uncharacterized protein LOC105565222 isoform X2 [Vollenhovia emeryi]|nr:PREDICTED: uncharacterized protein LOC105565222 isoform X2 [Vollenhovia emeryi]